MPLHNDLKENTSFKLRSSCLYGKQALYQLNHLPRSLEFPCVLIHIQLLNISLSSTILCIMKSFLLKFGLLRVNKKIFSFSLPQSPSPLCCHSPSGPMNIIASPFDESVVAGPRGCDADHQLTLYRTKDIDVEENEY